MSDFALSLLNTTLNAIVKVFVTKIAKHVVSRIKGRTTPMLSRDGSDAVK
ncbi:MAG: hypothetical protein FWB87_15060 [Defluviitaleaceae bacterium]|nr:hypothetical protein [Defluviitaleaceae bacterium]